MKNTIVHDEGATSLEGAVGKVKLSGSVIKLGLDMHAMAYVVVAQYDHLLPKAARRFSPCEFVPWVEGLLRSGHSVHVVYEACGFGFGLYRQLEAAGAHCYVIAPRKLDEQSTGVKTDPRDAADAVPAVVAICGRQHAGTGGDSGCRAKRRNKPGMFHGNANSWYIIGKA